MKFSNDPTWVMRFSSTGEFLATGGVDTILRIWRVIDISCTVDPMILF